MAPSEAPMAGLYNKTISGNILLALMYYNGKFSFWLRSGHAPSRWRYLYAFCYITNVIQFKSTNCIFMYLKVLILFRNQRAKPRSATVQKLPEQNRNGKELEIGLTNS